jgi:cysteine desulfuration protein SufE
MMMPPNENIFDLRSVQVEKEFSALSEWDKKYELIIQKGKNLPVMSETMKTEKNIVKGCQSQVWLFVENRNGHLHFFADSDALIVKGLIAILLELFQDLAPNAIIHADLEIFKKIGLHQHLSPSRSNGLQAMIKQMRLYAFVFSQMKK